MAFSSPWVEIIGIALGISTGWYFRRRDVITKRETQQQQLVVGWREQAVTAVPATRSAAAAAASAAAASADGVLVDRQVGRGWDGGVAGEAEGWERPSLSQRLARGVPVLGATG